MLLLLQPQRPALERGLVGGSPALLLSRAVHRRLQHFYLYKKKAAVFVVGRLSAVQEYRSTGNKTPFPPQIRYVSRVTGDKAILLAVMTFINPPLRCSGHGLVAATRSSVFSASAVLVFSLKTLRVYLSGQSCAVIMALSRATVL